MSAAIARASTGISIAFPDVCKTPGPPAGGVPIPYPATATTALKNQQKNQQKPLGGIRTKGSHMMPSQSGTEAGTAIGSPAAMQEAMQLRNSLNQVNAKLQALNSRDPNEWQKVLAEYAVLSSALYKTRFPDD